MIRAVVHHQGFFFGKGKAVGLTHLYKLKTSTRGEKGEKRPLKKELSHVYSLLCGLDVKVRRVKNVRKLLLSC